MLDFTIDAYRKYLDAIRISYPNIMLFTEYLNAKIKPTTFCMIRHDVDRMPKRALKMALIEKDMGIKATYYFRTKKHTFKPDIIRKVFRAGHEIGYHYENLSDNKGNISLALKNFENNLSLLRNIVPVRTIAMHGSPFSKQDNRDMWRKSHAHQYLLDQCNILGEVYLDINYEQIAYINDTGRNWSSCKANIRDKVSSNIQVDFRSGDDLLHFLTNKGAPRLIFQIHPERWTDNNLDYFFSYCIDASVNYLKKIHHSFTPPN